MTQRTKSFLLFFSIVLSIYSLLNLYLFWQGWKMVPDGYHTLYVIVYVLIAYAFIVGRILERLMLNWISTLFVFVGAYWLGAMVYFFLTFLVLDLVRVVIDVVPFMPPLHDGLAITRAVYSGSAILVIMLVVAGSLNARRIRVKTLQIAIDRPGVVMRPVTLAVASDIHLGTIINRKRIQRIVDALNSIDADVVLLAGDVVDEDLAPVIKQNLGEVLRTIQSRYGTFAITGNHEYIGGVDDAVEYLRNHGIRVLRDEAITVDGMLTLVGREDLMRGRLANGGRKPLADLLAGIERTLPIILLDHQPFRLHEAEKQGVDLQLSGHTHHGQMWPFNYITRRVYEVSWGYLKKGLTHYYVSCGVGTWGPPIKIGSNAEIVAITLIDGTPSRPTHS
jgi:uncharacterized protein